MRQLIIQVPRGAVIDIAKSHKGANLARFEGNAKELIGVVIVHVSNREVGKVLEKLQELPKVQITLIPTDVMTLQPPASEAPQQVVDVEERSPIEIFLSGLQSVGSWRGFLGYAALAGFVVWIGLYTNTAYLLVAAMLIAPFAVLAMNTAIATAWGDRYCMGRSQTLRKEYFTIFCRFSRHRLTESIQTQLLKQDFNVTPLVDVNVLETPAIK